jgi:hypothetical protein
VSQAYDQSTIGTPSNSLTFNDYSTYPIFRFRDTVPTKREFRELDVPIPETQGVADYFDFEGKSWWIIDGTMYPRGEAEYYEGKRKLRKLASLEVQQNDPQSDYGYVPYIWNEAGTLKQIFVKIQYVDGLGESPRNGFKCNFRLYCEIKYPTIFDVIPVTTQLGDATATISGSSGYPFLYPVLYGKTTYSSNGTINNTGDLATYPSFVIYGPINQPQISNVTTGEYLRVNTNLPTISDSLIITFDQDTPPSITQAGVSKYDSLAGTLFKLKPGINNLTLSGQSVGSGAYATVSALPAYPMS